MRDFLLAASGNRVAKKIVTTIGLPVTLPPILNRSNAPWSNQILRGRGFVVFASDIAKMALTASLEAAGGRIALRSEIMDRSKLHGLVFDASHFETLAQLDQLYSFFHDYSSCLHPNARVVILGTPPLSVGSNEETAVFEALSGFSRSLAKELGSRGTTVNLIQRAEESSVEGLLRFFLSDHAAFVTGQVIVAGGAISEPSFDAVLKDRKVLVTGAARGIGAAIARACAREGAKVLLLDHPTMSDPLETLANELRGVAMITDIADAHAVEVVAKKLWEHGPIHGVIHNAGITRDKSVKRMTPDQWSLVQKVNLDFPVSLTEHLIAPEQRDLLAKDASFVFLSSISGLAGNAGQTNYAATKSALIGYVRGVTARSFQTGRALRFNAVAPGLIETPMTAAMPFAVREVARRLNSLNQGGLPEDVAEAVLFLTSPIGSEVYGQTLRVCGQNLMGA